ncbi:hypothetical protein D3C84_1290550 [compost metagenome]
MVSSTVLGPLLSGRTRLSEVRPNSSALSVQAKASMSRATLMPVASTGSRPGSTTSDTLLAIM